MDKDITKTMPTLCELSSTFFQKKRLKKILPMVINKKTIYFAPSL